MFEADCVGRVGVSLSPACMVYGKNPVKFNKNIYKPVNDHVGVISGVVLPF